MNLKYEKKVIFEVDYSDMEEFINDHYGHDFELTCDQESCNDTSVSVTIKSGDLSEYAQKRVDAYKETGRWGFILKELMRDLCNKGLLEEGDYVILDRCIPVYLDCKQ